MLFDIGLNKAIVLMIVLAVIVNVTSSYEAGYKQGEDGKITIVSFYSVTLIYLIYSGMNEKIKNKKIAYYSLVPLVSVEWIYRLFNLYRTMPNLDILAHFLGGVGLTLVLVKGFNQNKKNTAILNILTALGWEAGEVFFDNLFPIINSTFLRDPFFWDGISDILFQLLGMISVYFFLKKTKQQI